MAFQDLLNKPLPSAGKAKPITEGFDGYDNFEENNIDGDLANDLAATAEVDDPEEPVPPMDPDEVELSPEESEEADRIINLTATPIVLKDALADKEMKEFAESVDFDIAVNEGYMMESDASHLTGDTFFEAFDNDLFMEAKFANKTKVQFSLKDRLSQLFEISVLGCARAKNDPDYIRLVKLQKARRTLKARLRQKYRQPATQKARMYLQRLKKSRSGVLSKVANTFGSK